MPALQGGTFWVILDTLEIITPINRPQEETTEF